MLYKYTTYIFFLAIFFGMDSHAITLEEAITAAGENNRSLRYYRHMSDAAKAEKFGAVGEFLPEISANANYGNKENRISGAENNSNKERYEEIRAEQSIFEGFGSVMRYKEADYKYLSQKEQGRDKRAEIVMRTSEIYCNLFLESQKEKIYNENKLFLDEILKIAQKYKSSRLISNSDYVKFKYEALNANRKHLETVAILNKVKREFKNTVGLEAGILSEPKIIVKKINPKKVAQDVVKQNGAVKTSYYQYLAAKYAHYGQKSQFSPKVSVVALASRQRNVVYLDQRDLNTQSLYLNLKVPLFQKGVEYSNLSKASSQRSAAKENYEIVKEEVKKQALQALDEYNLYCDLLSSSQELSDLAKMRLKTYKRRRKARNIDKIELLRAKIEYNQYLVEQLQVKIDLVKSYYRLNYFTGWLK